MPQLAIFDTCRPRADVLAGTIRDDEFMVAFPRVWHRKLTFSDTVPVPKIPEQLPLALGQSEPAEEEGE